jgi:hypothetical protein
MNGFIFPLHRRQKIVHGRTRPAALPTPDRRGLLKRLGELLLLVLLHYKWVLLVIWIAAIIFWFVSELLLIELEIPEADPEELH